MSARDAGKPYHAPSKLAIAADASQPTSAGWEEAGQVAAIVLPGKTHPGDSAHRATTPQKGFLTVAIFADLLYTFLIFWTRRRKGQWRRQNKSKSCFD